MIVADYIAKFLVKQNTTDVFGIPGGVLLDLLYAFENNDGITPHLSYHEQSAGFAALGYAQSSGKLGMAYATRGPGFTNLITPITDAYCDSIPVLFITAHTSDSIHNGLRVMDDQEIDTCSIVSKITKFARRIDNIENVIPIFTDAYRTAMFGRKGPVLLDIKSNLFKCELGNVSIPKIDNVDYKKPNQIDIVNNVIQEINKADKPILLIGDGINQANASNELKKIIDSVKIPVVSSRFSHNLLGSSELYLGYIGSHGIRAANFALSKADLVISMGNRLNFPIESLSYREITTKCKFIRFEIDEAELLRHIPNSTPYIIDCADILQKLEGSTSKINISKKWQETCRNLKKELMVEDINSNVNVIVDILQQIHTETTIVCDVGNNEFWVSRACVFTGAQNRVLYSKSLGTLGCGLGKAIGAYYYTRKPVLCFIGDQGLQMNSQELMFIGQHKLPILIVVINNNVSGMIMDKEISRFNGKVVHTTKNSGYEVPNLELLAQSYKINYAESYYNIQYYNKPILLNIRVDENTALQPNLHKGDLLQNLSPKLFLEKYDYLNSL